MLTHAGGSPPTPPDDLAAQLRALLADSDPVATLANAAALVFWSMADLNWAGFYLAHDGELVLGPFQGRPACIRIAWNRGVCGTAAMRATPLRVPDVHAFPGHIACDAASRSELVVPLLQDGAVRGVIDIDSPRLDRFDAADQATVESLASIVADHIDWAASPWRS